MEEINKSFDENSEFTEIIEYIKSVEDFKHCSDHVRAAALLETYKLTLDHVPGHLLKSKEVYITNNKNCYHTIVCFVYMLNNYSSFVDLECINTVNGFAHAFN